MKLCILKRYCNRVVRQGSGVLSFLSLFRRTEAMVCTSSRGFREICLETLREAGYRITKQRIAVIESLSKADSPLTAPELYERLSRRSKGAPLDKVSVYRVLDTLLELKLVHRAAPFGAYLACSHQDCSDSHHVLSRCTECDHVEELDVPNEVVAPLLFHMKESLHFTPDSHLLHMDGICSDCSPVEGSKKP